MLVCSVQIISRLDSQSKFQMLTLFSSRHIGVPQVCTNMAFSYWAPNILLNISTNISSLGKRTGLKLGELSSLFIFYNIAISWVFPLDGFWFIFLLLDSEKDLWKIYDWNNTKLFENYDGNFWLLFVMFCFPGLLNVNRPLSYSFFFQGCHGHKLLYREHPQENLLAWAGWHW